MRIASFNVENLFRRAKAMNLATWDAGKKILAAYGRLNSRLQKATYTAADKTAILKDLAELGLKKDDESEYVILRQNRGRLIKRPKSGPPQIVADGRGDWVGWLDLKTEPVDEIATQMTARVIKDVAADILAVIEAEDRIGLLRFNEQLLRDIGFEYDAAMLIDGNDDRGIDVGLLTRAGWRVGPVFSHVDDPGGGSRRVFSRDCPEFLVRQQGQPDLLILVNHFKSKGHGTQADSNAKREAQATRVREIYDERRSQGMDRIAIVGDFNDTPDSDPLKPLLKNGSDLRDITQHPNFHSDGRPGTYANGNASNKIDYVLLSPALFERVTSGGIFRMGVWGGKNGTLFPHYNDITKPVHAASDHAAIWAELDL